MRWVHDTASGPVAFGLPLPAARADRRQRSASTLTRGGPNLGGWSVFRTSPSGGETMTTYEGRLELTWTNKHLRLLAHEDGTYEWVPPFDYRVAEVRLLRDVESVGEVSGQPAKDNRLVRG